ncbi:NifB/NifX family molybdenum-iron cluster-binding protein [Pectobacterium peruviense]|uniref:Nitrogen fixation protein NifY n=1 Tax=Pectobacterium peruviense TaxID=2066479 RepID=A0ABX4S192_9GAMM|nr:NifB/NifX family molybdenum-iron cluster-binding protein [Pectobacterium peruviense]KML67773.1 protein NifY [Pectobacterium peruviense]PKX84265.1 nitrogen fixation protein NifY [Pectobacterium peruviense]
MSDDDRLFWRLFALIQCLPELSPPQLLHWLNQGEDVSLDVAFLMSLNQPQLLATFPGDPAILTRSRWRDVMACLRGELPPHLAVVSPKGRQPQLLAAFSSQDGMTINGHFGQCRLFFIYACDEAGYWLHGLRRYPSESGEQEGNEIRAQLLEGCHLLFCEAIGGPAAARIIRHNVHPMKVPPGTSILSQCDALQALMADRLPPWLAKRLEKGNPLEERIF